MPDVIVGSMLQHQRAGLLLSYHVEHMTHANPKQMPCNFTTTPKIFDDLTESSKLKQDTVSKSESGAS